MFKCTMVTSKSCTCTFSKGLPKGFHSLTDFNEIRQKHHIYNLNQNMEICMLLYAFAQIAGLFSVRYVLINRSAEAFKLK